MKVWSFIVFGTLFGLGVQQYQQLHIVEVLKSFGVRIPKEKVEVEKVVEIERERIDFVSAYEEEKAKASIPGIVMDTIWFKEGGVEKYRMSQNRFEKGHMDDGRAYTKNSDELHMWASSWCPLQVMPGIHIDKIKSCVRHYYPSGEIFPDWSALLVPRICACVGVGVANEKWEQAGSATSDPERRAWLTFKRYNGSGADAERYANEAMDRLKRTAVSMLLKETGSGETEEEQNLVMNEILER